jgi:hypothetical protein
MWMMEYENDDIFVELYKFHKKPFPAKPLIRPLYLKRNKLEKEKKKRIEYERINKQAFTESRLILEKACEINKNSKYLNFCFGIKVLLPKYCL